MSIKNKHNRPTVQKPKRWYHKKPDILLDYEVEPLLKEAHNYSFRDYTLILFALNTGLRNSECVGLNIEDVYPHGTIVSILKLPAEIAKNKKPRSIPLSKNTKKVLDNYINNWLRCTGITDTKSPLFNTLRTNNRLSSRDFQHILRKHSIKSIHRAVFPHMLRHTFATKLLEQSNIKIVQEILGHSCLQSSQIYLHPSPSEKIDAVNKLDFAYTRKE
ncbi:Tyrosine recombinase XerC [subsurface metagenome]